MNHQKMERNYCRKWPSTRESQQRIHACNVGLPKAQPSLLLQVDRLAARVGLCWATLISPNRTAVCYVQTIAPLLPSLYICHAKALRVKNHEIPAWHAL